MKLNEALYADEKRHSEKGLTTAKEGIERSSLYTFFRKELEEINRHKWLESEKAGRDMGFEWALLDWIRHHRTDWRRMIRL